MAILNVREKGPSNEGMNNTQENVNFFLLVLEERVIFIRFCGIALVVGQGCAFTFLPI